MCFMKHEQWASKLGFILASAGAAIGLGAMWKFPYVAGTSGGGAFFLLFLFFALFLGYPLLVGEFTIGRHAQSDAILTYKKLAPNTYWFLTGWIGIVVSFIVLSFYSVVGGWILLYTVKAMTGQLSGLTQEEYGALFGLIISSPVEPLISQFIFILLTIIVVASGIQKGIERASKWMMPALFVLFIVLVIRSLTLDGAMEGLKFLFVPDFSAITSSTILFALGQAFFTLTLGVSVMVTYSSYLSKEHSLPKSAVSIVILNIVIAMLAGMAIFPGIFTYGFEPGEGPALVFIVLPAVFNQLPFGIFFLTIFLLLFLFAALTSAFSMIEIIVAAIAKDDAKKRKTATWVIGILIFIVGIPSCLSFGAMSDVTFWGKTVFDLMDYVASNILIPIGALCISLFISFKVPVNTLKEEMEQGSSIGQTFFKIWFFLIRYVTPVAIIIVFLDTLGLLNFLKS
ncbi:sodium-dependent transporter [Aeribacillus kexueae]|uniref:sodium-dependent transporter n=1 Tax=Aeribacillus kexueae TaxID=2078952 RepID=UPI003AF1776B